MHLVLSHSAGYRYFDYSAVEVPWSCRPESVQVAGQMWVLVVASAVVEKLPADRSLIDMLAQLSLTSEKNGLGASGLPKTMTRPARQYMERILVVLGWNSLFHTRIQSFPYLVRVQVGLEQYEWFRMTEGRV